MNESELARHRTQMGHAAAAMAAGEGMDSCVEPGWWLSLSGAPSPDAPTPQFSS